MSKRNIETEQIKDIFGSQQSDEELNVEDLSYGDYGESSAGTQGNQSELWKNSKYEESDSEEESEQSEMSYEQLQKQIEIERKKIEHENRITQLKKQKMMKMESRMKVEAL